MRLVMSSVECNSHMLLHMKEFERWNILQDGTIEPIDYSKIARCVYSNPEMASVGLTEEEAKKLGYNYKSRKVSV